MNRRFFLSLLSKITLAVPGLALLTKAPALMATPASPWDPTVRLFPWGRVSFRPKLGVATGWIEGTHGGRVKAPGWCPTFDELRELERQGRLLAKSEATDTWVSSTPGQPFARCVGFRVESKLTAEQLRRMCAAFERDFGRPVLAVLLPYHVSWQQEVAVIRSRAEGKSLATVPYYFQQIGRFWGFVFRDPAFPGLRFLHMFEDASLVHDGVSAANSKEYGVTLIG